MALIDPQPLHPCVLWCSDRPQPPPFRVEPPRPEQPLWVDRLSLDAQPGKHPLHDQGAYYCLDYGSVLAASVMQTISKPVGRVLDVCASPGGKSLFAWRSLQPNWLLSNDVIGKRLAPLIANLKRCGVYAHSWAQQQPEKANPLQTSRISVASQDPAMLAQYLAAQIDVVIVDAPCTGQSLLAKGSKAEGCFHPVTINKNANRQKRIVANAASLLRPGGYLAYMTCAYSPEENEAVISWLLKKNPVLKPVAVPHLKLFQSHQADFPCYRFWPQSGLGAGGYSCLLQHTGLPQQPQGTDMSSDDIARCEISEAIIERLDIRPIDLG